MVLTTVKSYEIITISKKNIHKLKFSQELKSSTEIPNPEQKILELLDAKGKVYGISKKKELMGIYLFERVEEYFEENENGKITLGSRRIDLERFWYGESKAALKLQTCILTEECKSISEKLDKELKCAMSDLVYLGQIAGIEWGDELFYRRKPDNQSGTGKVLFLAFSGIGGFAIGWLLFDAWWLGIVYAMLLGSFMSFGVQNGNSKDWGMYHLNQILDAESEEKDAAD